jgi:hypothetical protein
MSTESIIVRVRRSNPVTDVALEDADLLARITALPGDPRLAEGEGRARPRHRRRVVVVAFAVGLAAILASAAYAISQWIGADVVRPPVTRQEYLSAQKQLTLPPAVSWPTFNMPPANSVTTRGGGGGQAVVIAMNAWECYWVRAIRARDVAAQQDAHAQLNQLLKRVYEAPEGAPEGWTPTPFPQQPFAVFAHDGGLDWIKENYAAAAAGDATGIAQSCRANAQ